MPQPTSHYQTLQVPENAPPEVIRAAFKSLALRWHPDKNHNSAESHRHMQSLNAAFAVLNDPVRRAQHDEWLLTQARARAKLWPTLVALGQRIVVRYSAPA